MPQYTLTLAHHCDASEDGAPHVPSFLAIEYAVRAWKQLFDVTMAGCVSSRELQVVHLVADFAHELAAGLATFDVALQRIGRSSLELTVDIGQNACTSAVIRFTLVQVDLAESRARTLSSHQLARLQSQL